MFLYEVMTPREIEIRYNLPHGSVIRDIHRNKFRPSEIRKSGAAWLITEREARRVYAGELTMIPVKDDFQWCLDHVKEELENPVLNDLVRRVLDKPFMNDNDVKNLTSLYHDGMRAGLNGNVSRMSYLPFSQWFYEFYQDQIEEVEKMEKEEKKRERLKKAFLEVQGSATDWSLAADKFVAWCVEKNFECESFDSFVEWIDEDKIDDNWDFFYGYGSDLERFSDDWVDHEERDEFLKFAKGEEK